MPLYDFKCDSCGVQIERMLPMDHEPVECPECEAQMRKIFGVAPQYHAFREGWYPNIDIEPVYVKSKKQLRHETRSRGLTSDYAED